MMWCGAEKVRSKVARPNSSPMSPRAPMGRVHSGNNSNRFRWLTKRAVSMALAMPERPKRRPTLAHKRWGVVILKGVIGKRGRWKKARGNYIEGISPKPLEF